MFPAQRFQSLSSSENIGLASLRDIKGSAVYNTVSNKLEEVSEGLKDLIGSLTGGATPPLDKIKDQVDESVRATRDVFSTLQDMTKLSPADIEKSVSDMLPDNPVLQTAFRQLSTQCRNSAMGNVPGFRGFKDKLNCGTPGQGQCSSSQVSGFLDKFTGGAIGFIAKTLTSMLRSLMTLANMGYTAGLCRIFGALANGMPGSVVQKAAAGAMALAAGRGNVNAVFDIAGGMGSSIPSLEIPSLVGRVTEGFKIPDNYKAQGTSDLYDASMETYSLIEPGFSSGANGIKTIRKMSPTNYNQEFAQVSSSYLNSGMNVGDLNAVTRKPNDSLAAAYIGSNKMTRNDQFAAFGF